MTIHPIAEKYAGEDCFLDDEPAVVQGRLLKFAEVKSLTSSKEATFSWEAVERVMTNNNRRFEI